MSQKVEKVHNFLDSSTSPRWFGLFWILEKLEIWWTPPLLSKSPNLFFCADPSPSLDFSHFLWHSLIRRLPLLICMVPDLHTCIPTCLRMQVFLQMSKDCMVHKLKNFSLTMIQSFGSGVPPKSVLFGRTVPPNGFPRKGCGGGGKNNIQPYIHGYICFINNVKKLSLSNSVCLLYTRFYGWELLSSCASP